MGRAFDIMAEKIKAALKSATPAMIGMFRSAEDDLEGGARSSDEGRLHSNNSIRMRAIAWRSLRGLHAHLRHDEPMAATTTSKPPMPSGRGAPTWRRSTRSCGPGRRPPPQRAECGSPLSTFENRSFDLADIGAVFNRTPICISERHRQSHRQDRARRQDFVNKHTLFKRRDDIVTACAPNIRWRRGDGPDQGRRFHDMTFEEYARSISDYTLKAVEMSARRSTASRRSPNIRRSEDEGHQFWT